MQNIAEFRIIGRVGKIIEHDKVTKVSVAANYNRQENGEWVTDTHWNEVTVFGKLIERARQVAEGRFGAYHWPGPAELLRHGRGQALHRGADRRRLRDPR